MQRFMNRLRHALIVGGARFDGAQFVKRAVENSFPLKSVGVKTAIAPGRVGCTSV